MRALAVLWGGVGLLLAGCSVFESSPEELCSSDETYASLLGIVVGQIQQSLSMTGASEQDAGLAKMQAALGNVKEFVSFRVPTVSGFDEATKKTSCQAVMDFQVPASALFAVPSGNLEINDARPDGVGIAISYNIQPSADGEGYVYRLQSADQLASVLSAAAANFALSATTTDLAGGQQVEPAAASPAAEEALPPESMAGNDFTPDEQRLVDAFLDANAQCRGSDSEAESEAGCRRSDVALNRMNAAGICWGRENEPYAAYKPHHCGPGSMGFTGRQ